MESSIIDIADEEELYLTDLIDVDMLQNIQDAFSDMTGMAALTTDSKGIAVTKGSNFTDFCMNFTRKSELGCKRCNECDKKGAEITFKHGKSCSYYCHAGLVDFAAPIMANGKIVGSFIGGQVLPSPPDLEKARDIAVELGIDPEQYIEAIKKVRIVDIDTISKAANSLYAIADTLSTIAYKSHSLYLSNIEIEKASHMKSDFLANMSHEIRTPMNAVLGMVDLALREEMSPVARGFIEQIKVSGKNLLAIINDILDFSKIESGKMEIVPDDYEFLSVINDVANIINNRIGKKDIEFTMDISPDIPKKLYGDNFRLHQILLNLLNNAVKFTQQGEVNLSVGCEFDGSENALLKIEVSDTGIGIKKKDMDKLFNSFQQVDSKRNRNVEGTGLGLAISRKLLDCMNGKISVQSEYNKGTTFFAELPQRIVDPMPSIPPFEKPVRVAVLSHSEYFKRQLFKDLGRIGADYAEIDEHDSIGRFMPDYFIFEKNLLTDKLLEYIGNNSKLKCIAVTPYADNNDLILPNVCILQKPVFSLGLYNAMGISNIKLFDDGIQSDAFCFTAPDARVLIVDDNTVNLTVAKGLIEPLKMCVDTACSAAEAIEKLKQKKYDLIFMDHMMPEVDGIEATHIIRRLMTDYNDVPIIALTANAINGAKEMFINEGMNDFVAKPIEIKNITAKLRQWLPREKIIAASNTDNSDEKTDLIIIDGLDTGEAVKRLGTASLYKSILKAYYEDIDRKAAVIEEHMKNERWRDYTVEVHSLKSTSKQIGASHLSHIAAELEKAGNDGRIDIIRNQTDAMLCEYRELQRRLKPYFNEPEEKKGSCASKEQILKLLDEMQEALDNFDSLQIDEVVEKMSSFDYSDHHREFFDKIRQAAEITDIDSCDDIVCQWRKAIAFDEK